MNVFSKLLSFFKSVPVEDFAWMNPGVPTHTEPDFRALKHQEDLIVVQGHVFLSVNNLDNDLYVVMWIDVTDVDHFIVMSVTPQMIGDYKAQNRSLLDLLRDSLALYWVSGAFQREDLSGYTQRQIQFSDIPEHLLPEEDSHYLPSLARC